MSEAVLALAVLACPVGMGLMMWFMARGMRGDRNQSNPSVTELRSEHERLGQQIEELEDRVGERVEATR
ncbi:MAG: hypothetical protein WKF48_07805 [Solirubrobacteraceae bacterium]